MDQPLFALKMDLIPYLLNHTPGNFSRRSQFITCKIELSSHSPSHLLLHPAPGVHDLKSCALVDFGGGVFGAGEQGHEA